MKRLIIIVYFLNYEKIKEGNLHLIALLTVKYQIIINLLKFYSTTNSYFYKFVRITINR